MATLSQSTATIDGARNLAVVDIEQGERFVLPVRFKTAGQNDDISSWVFSLTAETALAYVETDAAGNTMVRDAVPVEPMNPVVLPKVEVSSLEPSTVDIVIPPDLFTDEIMFDPLRAPVVVLYFRVQKGSAVDEPPVDIHRIPVVIRRGQKLDAPQSSTGPTLVVTGAQIRDQLQMLSGEQRLSATAVKGLEETVLPPARAGSTDKWGTDKVPTIQELGGTDTATASAAATATAKREAALRYTDQEKTKLSGIEDGAEANVRPNWNAVSGDASIENKPDVPDNSDIDARITSEARTGNQERWAKSKMPSDTVYTDTQRFTPQEKNKLFGMEANATKDQTPEEIRDALQTLQGTARLAASAIKDLPAGGSTGGTTTPRITNLGNVQSRDSENTADVTVAVANAFIDAWNSGEYLYFVIMEPQGLAAFYPFVPGLTLPALSAGGWTRGLGLVGNRAISFSTSRRRFGLTTEYDSGQDFPLVAVGAASAGGGGGSQTASQIRDALQTLMGTARLDASAIKNLPSGGGGGLTQTQVDARVRAGVIDQAETGNTSRWPKNKLPSDTAYGTIPAAQVPSDWDASTGLARILNKPTLVTAFTGLSDTPSSFTGQGGKYAAVNSGATALEFVTAPTGGGGGSTARSFLISARPSADITLAAATQLTWTAWTELETTPELAAAHAGNVVVAADFEVMVTPADDTGGGGDRCISEARLVRTRSSVDTVLIGETIYGPRNGSNFGGTGTNLFKTASREAALSLAWHDSAMAGDVYKLEARTITQRTSPTKTFTFHRDNNGLLVFPVGATYAPPPSFSFSLASFTAPDPQAPPLSATTTLPTSPAVVLPQSFFQNTLTNAQRQLSNFRTTGYTLHLGFNDTTATKTIATGKTLTLEITPTTGSMQTFTGGTVSNTEVAWPYADENFAKQTALYAATGPFAFKLTLV